MADLIDGKIYQYKYDPEDGCFYISKEFKGQDEFLEFVASEFRYAFDSARMYFHAELDPGYPCSFWWSANNDGGWELRTLVDILDLNLTGNDKKVYQLPDHEDMLIREFMYTDEGGRVLDPRNYTDLIEKILLQDPEGERLRKVKKSYLWKNRRRPRNKKMGRPEHRGWHYHESYPHVGMKTAAFLSDPEYKEYRKRKDKSIIGVQEAWWDDHLRLVSASWKDQCRARKSWGKHESFLGRKAAHDTIRRWGLGQEEEEEVQEADLRLSYRWQ